MQKKFLTVFSTHASTKRQKYLFFHKPLSEFNFFVILTSTYYNKSNLNVKESSDQYLIEMSILNGVSVQFCFFSLKICTKMGRGHSKTKFWWILKNEEKIKDIP